ncbi:hypothetical protein ILUMI_10963, partial [Ignelater luminosus]
KEFPRRKLHYGRSKNLGLYYLSSELNIKKVYELYLAKFEPNMHKLIEQNRKKTSDFKLKVTYDFFSKLSFWTSKIGHMFDIRHRHASFPITLPEAENKAYDGQSALQKLKYDNVMTLASKYVSEDCMPYYRSLKNNSGSED